MKWGKWVRRSDNEPLARIDIAFYLTRADMAGLLIAGRAPEILDDLTDLPKAQIKQAIRDQLKVDPHPVWTDLFVEDGKSTLDGSDITVDDVHEWAVRQVAKL